MLKHRLKMTLRELYARLLFHTGLHAVVDRIMPRRLTILAGHCVAPGPGDPAWPGGDHLPPDMKIGREKLERIVTWFQRRYRVCNIADGVAAMRDGGAGERASLLALSMDDGYRDNHDVMLPLLERLGVSATVFLESRPLDERRVSWSHKLFWILGRISAEEFVERYGAATERAEPYPALVEAARSDEPTYRVKRILKYEVAPAISEPAVDAVFSELGGVDAELCDALYMTWDDARALRDAGVELGGHTISHPILSSLDAPSALAEIRGGAEAMARELESAPVTFAYPWGRRWDFNDETRRAVGEARFATAVTMHAGTNDAETDPTRLHRLAIDDDAQLHLLVAEACGGFDLARRLGFNLSE